MKSVGHEKLNLNLCLCRWSAHVQVKFRSRGQKIFKNQFSLIDRKREPKEISNTDVKKHYT